MQKDYDYDEMSQELVERTKNSWDKREGDSNTKYFRSDIPLKLWKAQPTKGSPHIIDILPFRAGKNFPMSLLSIQPGKWAYCTDAWIHTLGNNTYVFCPQRNYDPPKCKCPICADFEALMASGIEWADIPHAPKRRNAYNVLVMDDAKTEAVGVQIWEASFNYSEKPISEMARSARGGQFTPFANPKRGVGKSIAFEVGNDTYKKHTGHRFEERDYDIPPEIVAQAIILDEWIVIHPEEELRTMMWGPSGEKPKEEKQDSATSTTTRRTLRGASLQQQRAPEPDVPPEVEEKPNPVLRRKESADYAEAAMMPSAEECEYGAEFGSDYGKYEQCDECQRAQKCAEEADRKDLAKAAEQKREQAQEQKTRTPLRRRVQ